jgi:hypothetical protein
MCMLFLDISSHTHRSAPTLFVAPTPYRCSSAPPPTHSSHWPSSRSSCANSRRSSSPNRRRCGRLDSATERQLFFFGKKWGKGSIISEGFVTCTWKQEYHTNPHSCVLPLFVVKYHLQPTGQGCICSNSTVSHVHAFHLSRLCVVCSLSMRDPSSPARPSYAPIWSSSSKRARPSRIGFSGGRRSWTRGNCRSRER